MRIRKSKWFCSLYDGKYIPYDEETNILLDQLLLLHEEEGECGPWPLHDNKHWVKFSFKKGETGEENINITTSIIKQFNNKSCKGMGKKISCGVVYPYVDDPEEVYIPRIKNTNIPNFEAADKVDHLVFVVHGIGEALWSKGTLPGVGDITENASLLRNLTAKLTGEQQDNSGEFNQGRIEFIAISWYQVVHDTKLQGKLESVTQRNIPMVRTLANNVIVDIM